MKIRNRKSNLNSSIEGVQIDDTLEVYKNLPLFTKKVEKANEMLRTVGLPKHHLF